MQTLSVDLSGLLFRSLLRAVTPDLTIIIAAGGGQTRIHRSGGFEGSKVMIPIQGVPLLLRTVSWLMRELSPKKIIIVVGTEWYDQQVVDYFSGPAWKHLGVEVYSTPNRGTGDAYRAGALQADTETLLFWNGDTFVDIDVEQLLRHFRGGTQPVVGAFTLSDDTHVQNMGAVRVSSGYVVDFDEASGLVQQPYLFSKGRFTGSSTGVYVVRRTAFLASTAAYQGEFSLERQVIPQLVRERKLGGWPILHTAIDLGAPPRIEYVLENPEMLQSLGAPIIL